jgi:hypothetical protein
MDKQMLAWDVETMGLNKGKDLITVAAIYSPEKQIVFRFVTLDAEGTVVKVADFDEVKEAFMKELDDAVVLCAFNGIGFDIPFITASFAPSPERVMRWLLKSVDVFETCKRACEGRTFGLNLVLELNGFQVKTGSGMEAVHQARAGDWSALSSYCMDDSRLTYEISNRSRVALPEGYRWRKSHGGKTHDPAKMLFMNIGPNYEITFDTGTLDQL